MGINIRAGCTYSCQSVDVRINKPIKCQLCEKWEDWIMEGEGIIDEKAKERTLKMAVEWLVEVYTNIPEEIGKNSWKKMCFE